MFTQFSPLQSLRFFVSNRRVVLSTLALVSLTAAISLSLRLVQSAPAGPASPQNPPASPAKPVVLLQVPGQVLIGETVTFKVKFDNAGTAVGYGPFVDIVLDAGGANIAKTPPSPMDPPCSCDGITFLGAQMIGVNNGPLTLSPVPSGFPINTACVNSPANGVQHPFGSSGVLALNLPAGAQLITLALPFGSFQPDQPEIEVEVTVKVSSLADANRPLTISARGGFQFGAIDALDNPTPDPPILSDYDSIGNQGVVSGSWIKQATTTPTVMIIKKGYSGPENETATGPNFPHLYTLTVDIADTQKVDNVILTDCLPDNMAFVQFKSITGGGTSSGPPTVGSAASSNCFMVTWPILTGMPGTDATAEFEFFIPEKDASGNLILGTTCQNVSNNKITATGEWTPTDICDRTPPLPVTVTAIPAEHILTDKCIAVQKSVRLFTDTGAPQLTPGDTLIYTLEFQISDFKTIGELQVIDRLSDGQSLFITPGTPAKLSVTDQYGTTGGDFILTTDLLEIPSSDAAKKCGVANGVTELTFKISQKMMSFAPTTKPRHDAGILTGGRATSNTAAPGATGKIEFYVKINDKFAFTQPGDPFVDKEDPINNCVDISGTVMTNLNPETPVPTPQSPMATAHDDSATAVALVGDTLTKVVYAVRRAGQFICAPTSEITSLDGDCSNLPGPPQEVRPGDEVTFRIEKQIPSTDAEQLSIEDWLPLPIFNVTGFTSTNASCAPATVPLVNQTCFHPLDTLHSLFPPNFFPTPASNSIKFDYGNIFDMNNVRRKIDILFTSKVRNDPFADKLFLTNEVKECENNTFGLVPCQIAVAQVDLREPNLKIRKGIIATSNPNGSFSDPASPQTTPPTARPPAGATLSLGGIAGIVNSNDLATGVLNSNISNVDANDLVTFAITIENVGGHPAFDVKMDDIVPSDCFEIVPNTTAVKLGSEATFTHTISPPGPGFTFTSPGPLAELNPTTALSGANIIVITFQAKVKADITPGCCQNRAEITDYASIANGPDFVAAGFNPPYVDTAEVCTRPTLTKSVVATSEAHTTPETSALGTPQVTIGEIVRYRLVVRLPEGSSPNLQITDSLPAGMKFLDGGTARVAFVSNGAGITHTGFFNTSFDFSGNAPPPSATLSTLPVIPAVPPGAITGGTGCGVPVTFNLGNVQNNDNDDDLEYVVIESNALVCNAAGNVDGITLSNTFSVSVNNATIVSSPPINVIVVEPNLTITKIASPTTVLEGGTVNYIVTITNGPVDAFNVQFLDALPPGLTLDPSSVSVAGNCFPPTGVNTAVPSVICAQVPKNGVVTINYKAKAPSTCPLILTNQAKVTWTSLPGPLGTTVNPTMSSTPGTSGAADVERNGVTPPLTLNDYAASASAPLTVRCPPCTPAPQDMVAWYPGEGNANDIQGSNHGTLQNGATFGAGKVGQAFSFDGLNDQVVVSHNANQNTGGQITIDAWVNPSSEGQGRVIAQKVSPSNVGGYTFQTGTNNGLVWVIWIGGTQQFLQTSGGLLTPGTFRHVAATYDGAMMRIFVDGVERQSRAVTGVIDPVTDPFVIGGNVPVPVFAWQGLIDEVELFNRALLPEEIQKIFTAGGAGKCKCPPITLNPPAGALPPGVVNIPYNQIFTATGGCSSPFTYTVTGGALPPGLTLSANGVLSGTPKQPGVYTFTITATDKCGCTKSQTYTLTVDCPTVPLPLFNTGVTDDGRFLAAGAKDPHYVLLPTSPVSPDAIVFGQTEIPNVWEPNGPNSQWIGPDVHPLSNSPAGPFVVYTYKTTFNMPAGADLSTAVIAGKWASDNDGEMLLNGSPVATLGPNDFGDLTSFFITSGFMPGMNKLEFKVRNRGGGGGTSPTATGLRVEMSGSVSCCPTTKADKCVITTSELHTMPANSNNGTPQVTIGEIIRYRLTATLVQGASPSFRFTDHLPPGLTYLGNPKVAFVSTGGAGTITSTAFSGAGLNVNASTVGACSGPTLTFILPAIQVTGGPFGSGTDPTFNLGDLTNSHSDPNLEYVIVEFNALVNNLPVNAPGLPNQNGATLSNFYEVFVGIGTPAPIATSTPSNVTVVEPHLDVQKTVTTTPPPTQATFTATIKNTGTAAAFDVQINDVLPTGLVLISPAPSVSVSPGSCAQPTLTVNGNALTVTAPTMPVVCTVTLTFTVGVSSTCSPQPNIAQVSYTSLPGGSNNTPVGTQPNNTGSVTPGPTGAVDGDRVYNTSAQAAIGAGGTAGGCGKPSCGCPLKISRFRANGPAGTGDEFVEIFNPSDSPVLVSSCSDDPAGSANGIGVFVSNGNGSGTAGVVTNSSQLACQIPGSTVIAGRGYYLCGGKDYSLGGLGNNGGTSHSVPDQTIGAGTAATGIQDIPDDAGLALMNIGSNIVTQCVVGSLGCCSGFNYPDPGGGGSGSALVYDKVGFRPYGPGSPINVGSGYPANIYPSIASQYCEGACLQPAGDASTLTLGPGASCPTTVGPAGTSFPVTPGGTLGSPPTPVCYGESGQYEFLRRQTAPSSIFGTLHRDTDDNADDFILVSPNPTSSIVGQTVTGIPGVNPGITSVLGAAGPYNVSAPPDLPSANFTQAVVLPFVVTTPTVIDPEVDNKENYPLGTITIRLAYTNNSGKTITGVRFKVDSLTTLCGNQVPSPFSASSIPATGNARNLLVPPNCGLGAGNFAILKALNSLTTTGVSTTSGLQTFHGTALEDLSAGPSSPLSPFGGGVDSALVLLDQTATDPAGDGVTGGKGIFNITPLAPGGVLRVQFKFGIVKGGTFQLLITPMATTTP